MALKTSRYYRDEIRLKCQLALQSSLALALLLVSLGVDRAQALTKATPIELLPGSSTNRDLTAGASEQFEISLNAGQLFSFSIEKGDLALSIVLYDANRQKLIEQVSLRYEMLSFAVPASLAGTYLLEIRSLESQGSPRHYILKVEPTRPNTTADQKGSVAQRLSAGASVLRADWTEKSLRQSIQQYDDAAAIWLSLYDSRNAAA